MPFISYTSNFEDVMINRALASVANGFYVDVGAFQPIVCSNTFGLYQRGWSGIAVEPQAKLLQLWRTSRPRDILVEAAMGAAEGTITLHELTVNDQLATVDADVLALHQREGRATRSYTVPQVTLNGVLSTHRTQGDIHLLSIDVEGGEKGVLEGWDRARFRPWLVVLESVLPNRPIPNHESWEALLLANGYEFVYFDAVNRFYLAREHLDLRTHFQHPPCVWDQFVDYRLVHAQQTARQAIDELQQLKEKLKTLAA